MTVSRDPQAVWANTQRPKGTHVSEQQRTFLVTRCPPEEKIWAKFLEHLSGQHKHELGFLPRLAYSQAVGLGRVFLCFENGEPCGYAIHGPAKRVTKIYQVVVTDDCRRVEHGTALVEAIRLVADGERAHELSCHVAEDLEAIQFWNQIGFRIVGERCRRQDRKRKQFRFLEERPGKRLDLADLRAQLKESKLTQLHSFLLKNNPSLTAVKFQRKATHNHQIVIE